MTRSTLNSCGLTAGIILACCLAIDAPNVCHGAKPQLAAQSLFSLDAARSARLLRLAARQAHPIYGAPAARQESAASNNSSQAAYEFSAYVDGRVSSGSEDMLMLRVGSGRDLSLDAIIPHDFFAPWLGSGSQVRLIARPLYGPQNSAALDGRADCTVVAAAPEDEMQLLEHPAGFRYSAAPPSLTQPPASRPAVISHASFTASASRLAPGHPICVLSSQAAAVYPLYRDQIHRLNRRLDDQTLDKITSSILGYSDYYKVDPRLIIAMMIAESNFDPNAVSRTGAVGLGQLMPGTAAGLSVDPRDLERSIGASVKILSGHVAQYGGADSQGLVPINTLLLTMAAYNAGGGAVHRYHGVPPYRETQAYVRRVASYYRQLCGT